MTSIDDNTRIDRSGPGPGQRRPIPPPPARTAQNDAPAAEAAEHGGHEPAVLTIRAWLDPVVDETGHDPRSRYVEEFWLGVLGPTATWLLRRLVAGLAQRPDGYELDLDITARAMGMSYRVGRSSPFSKALQRCTMFGLAHQTSDGIAVRRRVPTVAHRHLRRMPDALQRAHDEWEHTTVAVDQLTRAHRLALAMIDVGDDPTAVEHQLVAIGVTDAVAAEVADNARRL